MQCDCEMYERMYPVQHLKCHIIISLVLGQTDYMYIVVRRCRNIRKLRYTYISTRSTLTPQGSVASSRDVCKKNEHR